MGTTRTLADGEAFVQGRSQETAKKLVTAAKDADLKGSVRTTYDGYIAPVEVVEAAGFAAATDSSTPENPADHSDEANAKYDGAAEAARVASEGSDSTERSDDKDVDPEVLAQLEAEKAAAAAEAEKGELFDPTAHTIADVQAYLTDATDDERARVIAAEKESSKPRKGVTDLAATEEG